MLRTIPMHTMLEFLNELDIYYAEDCKPKPITGGECYDNKCRFIDKEEPICMFEGTRCVKVNQKLFHGLEKAYVNAN